MHQRKERLNFCSRRRPIWPKSYVWAYKREKNDPYFTSFHRVSGSIRIDQPTFLTFLEYLIEFSRSSGRTKRASAHSHVEAKNFPPVPDLIYILSVNSPCKTIHVRSPCCIARASPWMVLHARYICLRWFLEFRVLQRNRGKGKKKGKSLLYFRILQREIVPSFIGVSSSKEESSRADRNEISFLGIPFARKACFPPVPDLIFLVITRPVKPTSKAGDGGTSSPSPFIVIRYATFLSIAMNSRSSNGGRQPTRI